MFGLSEKGKKFEKIFHLKFDTSKLYLTKLGIISFCEGLSFNLFSFDFMIGSDQFYLNHLDWTQSKHVVDKKIIVKYVVIFRLNWKSIKLVW